MQPPQTLPVSPPREICASMPARSDLPALHFPPLPFFSPRTSRLVADLPPGTHESIPSPKRTRISCHRFENHLISSSRYAATVAPPVKVSPYAHKHPFSLPNPASWACCIGRGEWLRCVLDLSRVILCGVIALPINIIARQTIASRLCVRMRTED